MEFCLRFFPFFFHWDIMHIKWMACMARKSTVQQHSAIVATTTTTTNQPVVAGQMPDTCDASSFQRGRGWGVLIILSSFSIHPSIFLCIQGDFPGQLGNIVPPLGSPPPHPYQMPGPLYLARHGDAETRPFPRWAGFSPSHHTRSRNSQQRWWPFVQTNTHWQPIWLAAIKLWRRLYSPWVHQPTFWCTLHTGFLSLCLSHTHNTTWTEVKLSKEAMWRQRNYGWHSCCYCSDHCRQRQADCGSASALLTLGLST